MSSTVAPAESKGGSITAHQKQNPSSHAGEEIEENPIFECVAKLFALSERYPIEVAASVVKINKPTKRVAIAP